MSKQLAVIGSPIEHSKSPQIHAAAYAALGLDWNYSRVEVRQSHLMQFVESLDESWLGLSVTMPLKYEAMRISSWQDPIASATGVANTLYQVDSIWRAYNTDVQGIQRALGEHLNEAVERVLIIGSGATAASAIYAISTRLSSARITLVARDTKAANELAARFSNAKIRVKGFSSLNRCLSGHDIVVSTIPSGALQGAIARLQKSWLRKPKGVLLDVTYDPWPSKAARLWQKNELPVVSGVEMLIFQAITQCRIFISHDPDIELPNERAIELAMRNSLGLI